MEGHHPHPLQAWGQMSYIPAWPPSAIAADGAQMGVEAPYGYALLVGDDGGLPPTPSPSAIAYSSESRSTPTETVLHPQAVQAWGQISEEKLSSEPDMSPTERQISDPDPQELSNEVEASPTSSSAEVSYELVHSFSSEPEGIPEGIVVYPLQEWGQVPDEMPPAEAENRPTETEDFYAYVQEDEVAVSRSPSPPAMVFSLEPETTTTAIAFYPLQWGHEEQLNVTPMVFAPDAESTPVMMYFPATAPPPVNPPTTYVTSSSSSRPRTSEEILSSTPTRTKSKKKNRRGRRVSTTTATTANPDTSTSPLVETESSPRDTDAEMTSRELHQELARVHARNHVLLRKCKTFKKAYTRLKLELEMWKQQAAPDPIMPCLCQQLPASQTLLHLGRGQQQQQQQQQPPSPSPLPPKPAPSPKTAEDPAVLKGLEERLKKVELKLELEMWKQQAPPEPFVPCKCQQPPSPPILPPEPTPSPKTAEDPEVFQGMEERLKKVELKLDLRNILKKFRRSSNSTNQGNEKPYNPDDDPRFYPLPKSTAKRKFEDSDSSGEEGKGSKTYTQMTTVTSAQLAQLTNEGAAPSVSPPKKPLGRPPGSGANKTPAQPAKKRTEASSQLPASDPLFLPPRRETSKRKAKEKSTIKNFLDKQQNLEEEPDDPDFVDSDTDPVWMPSVKGESDEEGKTRKRRQRSLIGKGMGAKRRPADAAGSSSEEEREGREGKEGKSARPRKPSSGLRASKPKTPQKESVTSTTPVAAAAETNDVAAVGTRLPPGPVTSPAPAVDPSSDPDAICNKTGEFVVMKSDLHEEYPPIWRIDGKTLLQKYEPFDENGKTLYRNISTYSGWTAANRHIYVTVPVRFRVQSRMETIVEFMRDEIALEDPKLMERVMKDLEKYQDPFEVYLQTLISQSLDSNFLTEILEEQDEYFLTNVKAVDEVTEDHCRRLLNVTRWHQTLISSVKTYPALNVFEDLSKEQTETRPCAGCDKPKVSMRIQVFGQPYNKITLEGSEPDHQAPTEKDFLLCSACGWRISLLSKATHQKYLMFIECAKTVAERRAANPEQDTATILNELLADEPWLAKLFLDVRTTWAQIEKIEHEACESTKSLLQTAVASAGIQ